jgi:hypothetical protein
MSSAATECEVTLTLTDFALTLTDFTLTLTDFTDFLTLMDFCDCRLCTGDTQHSAVRLANGSWLASSRTRETPYIP